MALKFLRKFSLKNKNYEIQCIYSIYQNYSPVTVMHRFFINLGKFQTVFSHLHTFSKEQRRQESLD